MPQGALSVEALVDQVKKQDRRMPPEPSPFGTAAAYLALEPERQEAEPLLTAYLILWGPPVETMGGKAAAGVLVEFLLVEIKGILERVKAKSSSPPRTFKIEGIELVEESARGCLELRIQADEPLIVMIKTPHATGASKMSRVTVLLFCAMVWLAGPAAAIGVETLRRHPEGADVALVFVHGLGAGHVQALKAGMRSRRMKIVCSPARITNRGAGHRREARRLAGSRSLSVTARPRCPAVAQWRMSISSPWATSTHRAVRCR